MKKLKIGSIVKCTDSSTLEEFLLVVCMVKKVKSVFEPTYYSYVGLPQTELVNYKERGYFNEEKLIEFDDISIGYWIYENDTNQLSKYQVLEVVKR